MYTNVGTYVGGIGFCNEIVLQNQRMCNYGEMNVMRLMSAELIDLLVKFEFAITSKIRIT